MTFFNRKEEVIDIELTQFGKHLLSKGLFRPEYYAFFDDDIIYDTKFAGIASETQNEIEPRIKETPRLKTQYVFSGIETEINRSVEESRREAVEEDSLDRNAPPIKLIQPTADRNYATSAPLGTAKIGSPKSPAWKVSFLKGELSGSVNIEIGTKQPAQPIPQLDVEVIYDTFVRTQLGDEVNLITQDALFEDGTYISLEDNSIVLEVGELNGRQLNGEFKIEVYSVEEEQEGGVPTGKEILTPLNFQKRVTKNYKITPGNIYVRQPVDTSTSPGANVTNVEYWLDMRVDSEIDELLMCELKPVDKTKGVFSNRTYECEDARIRGEQEDIYSPSTVFEDPCDDE